MLKRIPYGLRNIEVYWRKMLLGFAPSRSYFHIIRYKPHGLDSYYKWKEQTIDW